MKFSLGGSSGNWWGKFAKNFSDRGGVIGNFGKTLTSGLSQTRDSITAKRGGFLGEVFHKKNPTGRLSKGLANLDRSTMGWSRQLSPLWEGGLTKPGGTTQDILDMGEHWGMAASHHISGTNYYADKGGSSGGGGGPVVSSESEDPSLINQGNWQAPGQLESFMRRENMSNRGGLATDLTKTKRGRQTVADVA